MEQNEIEKSTLDLINAARIIFEDELAKGTDTAPILKRTLNFMTELRLDPERAGPQEQSVCRHLSRTLDLGEAGPAAPVAKAIRALEPTLHWRQNPKYNVENKGVDFMGGYAFSDFGLIGSTVLYIGVVLLGPGVTYPPTTYLSSEGVFLVIGGSPAWKCGDEPRVLEEAGRVIVRPMDGAEGKRSGKEPMLALYAWVYP